MKKEEKKDPFIEMYAKIAIVIYNTFDLPIYRIAKENKYPYSECLYQYYCSNNKQTNGAMLFINSIYRDEVAKSMIENMAMELNTKKKLK